jgi:hypothetical protein
MRVLEFLEGKSTDNFERVIHGVWNFNDQQIEKIHSLIQWLFPLAVPNASVPGAPILTKDDIAAIRASHTARDNIYKSAEWYGSFLERNDFWKNI